MEFTPEVSAKLGQFLRSQERFSAEFGPLTTMALLNVLQEGALAQTQPSRDILCPLRLALQAHVSRCSGVYLVPRMVELS